MFLPPFLPPFILKFARHSHASDICVLLPTEIVCQLSTGSEARRDRLEEMGARAMVPIVPLDRHGMGGGEGECWYEEV